MEKIVDDNTYYMNYSTTNYCRNNKKMIEAKMRNALGKQ